MLTDNEEWAKQRFEELSTWLNENRERALWHREQSLGSITDVSKQIAILQEIETEKEQKLQEWAKLKSELEKAGVDNPDKTKTLQVTRSQMKTLNADLNRLLCDQIPEEKEFLDTLYAAYQRFQSLGATLTEVIEQLTEKAKEEATKVPINLNLNITSLCDGKQIESAVIRRRKTSYLQQYKTVRTELLSHQNQFESYEDVARYLLSEVNDETISTQFDDAMRSYDVLNQTLEDRSRLLEAQIAEYERYAKTFTTGYDLVLQLDSRISQLARDSESLSAELQGATGATQSAVDSSRHARRLINRVQEIAAMRDAGQELVDSAVTSNERVLSLLGTKGGSGEDGFDSRADDVMSLESDTFAIRHAHEQTLLNERSQLLSKWSEVWTQLSQISEELKKVDAQYANAASLADNLSDELNAARAEIDAILNLPDSAAEKHKKLKKVREKLNEKAKLYLSELRKLGHIDDYEAAYNDVSTKIDRLLIVLENADTMLHDLDAMSSEINNWITDAVNAKARITDSIYPAKESGSDRCSSTGSSTPARTTPLFGLQHKVLLENYQNAERDINALKAEIETIGSSKLDRFSRAIEELKLNLGGNSLELNEYEAQLGRFEFQVKSLSDDLSDLSSNIPTIIGCCKSLENSIQATVQWITETNESVGQRKPISSLNDIEQQLNTFQDLLANFDSQKTNIKSIDKLTKQLLQALPPNFNCRKLIDENVALQTELENVQARLKNFVRNFKQQAIKRKLFNEISEAIVRLLEAQEISLGEVENEMKTATGAETQNEIFSKLLSSLIESKSTYEREIEPAFSELQSVLIELEKQARLIDVDAIREEETQLQSRHADLTLKGRELQQKLECTSTKSEPSNSNLNKFFKSHDDLKRKLENLTESWQIREAQKNRKLAVSKINDLVSAVKANVDDLHHFVNAAKSSNEQINADDLAALENSLETTYENALQLQTTIANESDKMYDLQRSIQNVSYWLTDVENVRSRPPSRSLSRASSVSSHRNSEYEFKTRSNDFEITGQQKLEKLQTKANLLYGLMHLEEAEQVKEAIAALSQRFNNILNANNQSEAKRGELAKLLKKLNINTSKSHEAANFCEEQLNILLNRAHKCENRADKLKRLVQKADEEAATAKLLLSESTDLLQAAMIDSKTCDDIALLISRFIGVSTDANASLSSITFAEKVYAKWHEQYVDCVAKIDSIEKQIANEMSNALQNDISRQQYATNWQYELDAAQNLRDELLESLQSNYNVLWESEREAMRQNLEILDGKYNRVTAALRDFLKVPIRTDLDADWARFDRMALTLSTWLVQAERSVAKIGSPAIDHATRMSQLDKITQIEVQLPERRDDVELLSEAYREANTVVAFSDKLDTLMSIRSRMSELSRALAQVRVAIEAPSNRLIAYKTALRNAEKALIDSTFEVIQINSQGTRSRKPSNASLSSSRCVSPMQLQTADQCDAILRTISAVTGRMPQIDELLQEVTRLGEDLLTYQQDDPDLYLNGDVALDCAKLRDARNKLRMQCAQLNDEYADLSAKWKVYFDFLSASCNFLKADVRDWLDAQRSLENDSMSKSDCEASLNEADALLKHVKAISNDLQTLQKFHLITISGLQTSAQNQHYANQARQLDNLLFNGLSNLDEMVLHLRSVCALKQVEEVHNWIEETELYLDETERKKASFLKTEKPFIENLKPLIATKRAAIEESKKVSKEVSKDLSVDETDKRLVRLAARVDKILAAIDRAAEAGLKSSSRRSSLSGDEKVHQKTKSSRSQHRYNSMENLNGQTRDVASQTIKNRKVQTDRNSDSEQSLKTSEKLRTMLGVMRGIQSELTKKSMMDKHDAVDASKCVTCGHPVVATAAAAPATTGGLPAGRLEELMRKYIPTKQHWRQNNVGNGGAVSNGPRKPVVANDRNNQQRLNTHVHSTRQAQTQTQPQAQPQSQQPVPMPSLSMAMPSLSHSLPSNFNQSNILRSSLPNRVPQCQETLAQRLARVNMSMRLQKVLVNEFVLPYNRIN